MITVLGVTWLILFSSGVFAQLITSMLYGYKLANQTGGIMSLMFLIASTPVAFYAFEHRFYPVILIATLYLCVNAWVMLEWKFHPLRTTAHAVDTAWRLTLLMAVILGLQALDVVTNLVVASVSLTLSLFILWRVQRVLANAKSIDSPSKEKQPSVSLAIPARNETHALTRNLKSIVGSDYKKLEILVVDDCSQDDTAQIIRSFAHDGVRFVQGHVPQDTWIGKNGAYQLLEGEASGEIVIFSGVDTRYNHDTISNLVATMQTKKLDMVSVLPLHQKVTTWSLLVQPVRYLLTLGISLNSSPPVLSTVWAIRASTLDKLGGFAAVRNSISPERFFARQTAMKRKYGFMAADTHLKVSSHKRISSQIETSVRLLYPLLRRSLFMHGLFSLLYVALFAYPLAFLITSIVGVWSLTSTLFLISQLALFTAYALILHRSYPSETLAAAPVFYLLGGAFYYYLAMRSAYEYEQDRVIWKGRNVCQPLMMPSPKS